MKQPTDEQLQDLFENDPQAFAELARTDEDARLYGMLYASLPRLDAVVVPADLSERVLARLEIKEAKTKQWHTYLMVAGIALTIVCGLVASWVLSPEMVKSFAKIRHYLPWSAAAALAFFGLEWLDQKIIWNKTEQRLSE